MLLLLFLSTSNTVIKASGKKVKLPNNLPEGPSITLVKEAAAKYAGKTIIAISGNSKLDQSILINKKIIEFKSWRKHFLICLDGLALRVHFLMYGSYTIDEKKPERY